MIFLVNKVNTKSLLDFVHDFAESDRVVQHEACYEEHFSDENALADTIVLDDGSYNQLNDGCGHARHRHQLHASDPSLLILLVLLNGSLVCHVDLLLEELHHINDLGDDNDLRDTDADAESIRQVVHKPDDVVG